jgi:hypothetical protein
VDRARLLRAGSYGLSKVYLHTMPRVAPGLSRDSTRSRPSTTTSPEQDGSTGKSNAELPHGDQVPGTYFVTKSERYVFGTPPYSERIKTMWRFKDKDQATRSASDIFSYFEKYRQIEDFVG